MNSPHSFRYIKIIFVQILADMRYNSYLIFNPESANDKYDSLGQLQKETDHLFSSLERGEFLIGKIMPLFQKAFNLDNELFLSEVFLKHQVTLRGTYDHQDYIFTKWENILKLSSPLSRIDQIEMVNIYRNIVSDLFDPYLSILVACLKFYEDEFVSYVQANLEMSESQKVKFIKQRMVTEELFAGYFPIIRNSISHAGTHSIVYTEQSITFKNIKRTKVPVILDTFTVSNAEFMGYIKSLIDLIVSIKVCSNIFGIDVQESIINNKKVKTDFIHFFGSPELFEHWREQSELKYTEIWNSKDMTENEKIDIVAKDFADECRNKSLRAKTLNLSNKDNILIVEVEPKLADLEDSKSVTNRIIELIMFALIAEPLFFVRYSSFLIIEDAGAKENSFQVWLQGDKLKDFGLRRSKMYNLINDAKIYLNKVDYPIYVDFEKIDELQSKSFYNF